jgi:excisionase family DNA binding protein
MLTVKTAAERLGVSASLVYGLCAARKLRHERHGMKRGCIRIPEEAIAEYRRRRTVEAEGEPKPAPPAPTTRRPRLDHLSLS